MYQQSLFLYSCLSISLFIYHPQVRTHCEPGIIRHVKSLLISPGPHTCVKKEREERGGKEDRKGG